MAGRTTDGGTSVALATCRSALVSSMVIRRRRRSAGLTLDPGMFLVCVAMGLLLTSAAATADYTTFRSLFTRNADRHLSGVNLQFISNTTAEGCAERCVKGTEFPCKSFDYDNARRSCVLFSVNLGDQDVHLIDSPGTDHYETAYSQLYDRLPSHRLPVAFNRQVAGVFPEECARRCMLETSFKCRGFNFRRADEMCMLLELTPATATAAIFTDGMDYFQRKPEGPLSNFINYGMGVLRPLPGAEVHQRGELGLSLEGCAAACLMEDTFDCQSFDYVFEGRGSKCYLSKYIATNVFGLVIDQANPNHNHFEKVGSYLAYFYATPYSVVPGNDHKQYHKVTPNRCAYYCLHETTFVCRSFDYDIDGGVCLLSDLTGSDIGGLYVGDGFMAERHHFEMKPLLDCGGNLTAPSGDVASPGWPRNYFHHEHCVWSILTSPHKVLHLTFTYFELGLQSADPCNLDDDRLMVTEKGQEAFCVMPNTKTITTKNNEISLEFVSNGEVDSQGFRLFYSAEWTCDVHLDEPGEIASPKWPDSYPSASKCSWRITAPRDHRVTISFTSFELEQHQLGHCNEQYDHVNLQDGGTVKSPLIGLYCGSQRPFVLRSSGRDMLVQFVSDKDPDNSRQGFHAHFAFERNNGSLYDGGGLLHGPGYAELGGVAGGDQALVNELDGEAGQVAASSDSVPASVHIQYKRTMWAVVTVLLLALVAALVGLFLVFAHYRRRGDGEEVHQDGLIIVSGEEPHPQLPPPPTRVSWSSKFNNDVTLPGPSTPCLEPEECGAAGGATADDCTFNNDLQLGKYAKENMKNINVDYKC